MEENQSWRPYIVFAFKLISVIYGKFKGSSRSRPPAPSLTFNPHPSLTIFFFPSITVTVWANAKSDPAFRWEPGGRGRHGG